jgi:hypothetical protein
VTLQMSKIPALALKSTITIYSPSIEFACTRTFGPELSRFLDKNSLA